MSDQPEHRKNSQDSLGRVSQHAGSDSANTATAQYRPSTGGVKHPSNASLNSQQQQPPTSAASSSPISILQRVRRKSKPGGESGSMTFPHSQSQQQIQSSHQQQQQQQQPLQQQPTVHLLDQEFSSPIIPVKPLSAQITREFDDMEVITPLGLESAHTAQQRTTSAAPSTVATATATAGQAIPEIVPPPVIKEPSISETNKTLPLSETRLKGSPVPSISVPRDSDTDTNDLQSKSPRSPSPTGRQPTAGSYFGGISTISGFGGGGLGLNHQNYTPELRPIGSALQLDSLMLGFKQERENIINFLKLDEYLEGYLSNKQRKKSLEKQEKPTESETGGGGGGDGKPTETKIPMEQLGSGQTYFQESHSRLIFYSMEDGIIEGNSLGDLHSATDKPLSTLLRSQYFWIDSCNPSKDDIKTFATIFNIHPLTMEDILTDGTREKFELYKSYYFICYCAFDQNPESATYMQSFNVYILVFSNFVLSFHFCPLMSVGNVIKRLEHLKSYLKITPHWINYALLDDITDKYVPLIHSIEMEVDSIDDLVLVISQTEQSDMLRRIAHARKRVMTLQRLLVAKSDVLRVLMKRLDSMANGSASSSLPEYSPGYYAMLRDTSLYLGDVLDHVVTMVQTLSHVDTILSRCHSNYLAHINIELTTSSNAANDAVAKLTILASLLVPLNVITGLWGMNVNVPGQATGEPGEGFMPFFLIVASMVIVVIIGWVLVHNMRRK